MSGALLSLIIFTIFTEAIMTQTYQCYSKGIITSFLFFKATQSDMIKNIDKIFTYIHNVR